LKILMKGFVNILFSSCKFTAVVFGLSLTSCYYDVQEELHPEVALKNCDTSDISYSSFIAPFIQNNCISCHTTGNSSGEVNLSSYSLVKDVANSGRLMGALDHASGFAPMPEGQPMLSSCTRGKIRSWINAGALNN
jgi:hypothetical protein